MDIWYIHYTETGTLTSLQWDEFKFARFVITFQLAGHAVTLLPGPALISFRMAFCFSRSWSRSFSFARYFIASMFIASWKNIFQCFHWERIEWANERTQVQWNIAAQHVIQSDWEYFVMNGHQQHQPLASSSPIRTLATPCSLSAAFPRNMNWQNVPSRVCSGHRLVSLSCSVFPYELEFLWILLVKTSSQWTGTHLDTLFQTIASM